MRIDELVSLNDVLKSDQYLSVLNMLKVKANSDINITRIKNKIIRDWKRGMKSRKHFDNLLSQIDINLNDVIKK